MENLKIEIFDVEDNLPKNWLVLKFLPFYKYGKWKKIWRLINYPTKDNPEYIIFQNIHKLRNKNNSVSEKIEDLVILYNHKEKGYFKILYDFFESLEQNVIHSVFIDEPGQYGLRGDVELWQELLSFFENQKFPENEKEFYQQIQDGIKKLTGKSTIHQEDFFVEKYYHGSGMSGGMISTSFWNFKAIPLLVGRFRKLKTMHNKELS